MRPSLRLAALVLPALLALGACADSPEVAPAAPGGPPPAEAVRIPPPVGGPPADSGLAADSARSGGALGPGTAVQPAPGLAPDAALQPPAALP